MKMISIFSNNTGNILIITTIDLRMDVDHIIKWMENEIFENFRSDSSTMDDPQNIIVVGSLRRKGTIPFITKKISYRLAILISNVAVRF